MTKEDYIEEQLANIINDDTLTVNDLLNRWAREITLLEDERDREYKRFQDWNQRPYTAEDSDSRARNNELADKIKQALQSNILENIVK